jgi:hypothetical protein
VGGELASKAKGLQPLPSLLALALVSCGTVWKGAVAVVDMMAESSEGREAAEGGATG